MNAIEALYYCLNAVARAAGTLGQNPRVLERNRRFLTAFAAHDVPNDLLIAVGGERMRAFFGGAFPNSPNDEANILGFAVESARDAGLGGVAFDMDLRIDTSLGFMALTFAEQNPGASRAAHPLFELDRHRTDVLAVAPAVAAGRNA